MLGQMSGGGAVRRDCGYGYGWIGWGQSCGQSCFLNLPVLLINVISAFIESVFAIILGRWKLSSPIFAISSSLACVCAGHVNMN